ncbi:hypothetical protein CYMTET_17794 [Cymbomonas tetramitiformis]|uniref:Calpain catalytic domain-containing protein n=1 Tax=Cymbomonas tetramitiformis TaxID=36881 RepID=A0AAE0G9E8_9CHLO|nr:hypothetical protein CYMTET_17794 [Cymbomonas tetramitiformis]
MQGGLGDCWLMAALSILAEFPQRFERLFVQKEGNEFGCYAVRVCKNGTWRTVMVDDYLPSREQSAAFSRTFGGELWVSLIEKTMAKLHGSFAWIEVWQIRHALTDHTGAPSAMFHFSNLDVERLWGILREADDAKYCIGTSIGLVDEKGELKTTVGLANLHAYGVIQARELSNPHSDGPLRLVQVRNPWGQGVEWNGDWSDSSELWTEELKAELGWAEKEDGTYWMTAEDFHLYFEWVGIACIRDKWHHSSIVLTEGANAERTYAPLCTDEVACWVVRFDVTDTVVVDIGFHQTDARCFPQKGHRYRGACVTLVRANFDDDEQAVTCLGTPISGSGREHWRELTLSAGTYFAFCFASKATGGEEEQPEVDFVLSAYCGGSEALTLHVESSDDVDAGFGEGFTPWDVVGEALKDWEPCEEEDVRSFMGGRQGWICHQGFDPIPMHMTVYSHSGIMAYSIDNSTEDTEMTFTITFTEPAKNMIVVHPQSVPVEEPFDVVVPPRSSRMLFAALVELGGDVVKQQHEEQAAVDAQAAEEQSKQEERERARQAEEEEKEEERERLLRDERRRAADKSAFAQQAKEIEYSIYSMPEVVSGAPEEAQLKVTPDEAQEAMVSDIIVELNADEKNEKPKVCGCTNGCIVAKTRIGCIMFSYHAWNVD